MLVIGVDPGLTGGIAAVCNKRGLLAVDDLPVCSNGLEKGAVKRWIDAAKLGAMLAEWSMLFGFATEDVTMACERAIPMPGQSVWTAASSFDSMGVIRAVAALRRLPLHLVTPREWKASYGLGKDKNASRTIACDLYPIARPKLARAKDHNRAEAILIGRYVLRGKE